MSSKILVCFKTFLLITFLFTPLPWHILPNILISPCFYTPYISQYFCYYFVSGFFWVVFSGDALHLLVFTSFSAHYCFFRVITSFWIQFSACWRIFIFSSPFRNNFWDINWCLYLSKIVFILPSLLNDDLTRWKILEWLVFLPPLSFIPLFCYCTQV